MRKWIVAFSTMAALAAPAIASAASSPCEARAEHRKVVGTALGALAGAVIGNQVSHGGGAVVGGLGGAVVGNQLARTSCDHVDDGRRYYGPPPPLHCRWRHFQDNWGRWHREKVCFR